MNRDPMDSFNKPFQSGDGLCYPIYAKNYYKTQTTPMFGGRKTKKSQKGGNTIGDYYQPSTPSDYPPGNAYLSSPNQRNSLTGSGVSQAMNRLTESFLNSNMGITYATQAGGRQKKNKRGGIGANEFNGSAGVMNQKNNQNSGTLNRAEKQQQSGGKNVGQEEMLIAPTQVLSASAPSSGVFPIVSGGKYKKYSKKGGNPDAASIPREITESFTSIMSGGRYKKYSKKGGNTPPGLIEGMTPGMTTPGITTPGMATPGMATPGMQQTGMQQLGMQQPGMQQPGMQQPGMQQPSMQQPGMQQPSMTGGRYKKYSKKGGNHIFTPGANFSSQPAEIATQMDPRAQAQHIPRGGFAMKNLSGVDAQMAASGSIMSGGRKKSSRKLNGGVSDFATTLSSRGPINYPDGLSAQRFRYFNKTGTYIPNSQLQYAAAPISTGYEADPNPYPMAYNDYIGGAKKKKAPAKKKAASDKKKAAPAKKKAAPAKKKSTSDKKKKSASDKKKK